MARGINKLIWCYYYVPLRVAFGEDILYKLRLDPAGLTSKEYYGDYSSLGAHALYFFLGVASNLSTSGFNSVDVYVNNLDAKNLGLYVNIFNELKSSLGAKVWFGKTARYDGEGKEIVWVPLGFRIVVPGGVIHIWDQSQVAPSVFSRCFDHKIVFTWGIRVLDPEQTLIMFNRTRALKGGAVWVSLL